MDPQEFLLMFINNVITWTKLFGFTDMHDDAKVALTKYYQLFPKEETKPDYDFS